MSNIFENFLKRDTKICYKTKNPGTKSAWKLVDCGNFDIKALLRDSLHAKKCIHHDGYYKRGEDENILFYTKVKDNDTLVFGSDYRNWAIEEFEIIKLKVVFE